MANSLITLSDKGTKFTTIFNPPISLKGQPHEMALISLETYYSYPNINEENNVFKYSSDDGVTWKTITLPKGSYTLGAIQREIKRVMRENGDYDEENETYPISVLGNVNMFQIVLKIDAQYSVNFKVDNSIRSVFGFNSKKYGEGLHKSESIVNILPVNSIQVHVSNVVGSYTRGTPSSVIYSFFPNVPPGVNIIERPYESKYLPIIPQDIHKIDIELTDQNGKTLDLRGEEVSVSLHLRAQKRTT